jgi:hypothetical protein
MADKLLYAYRDHERRAQKRNIPFRLTYEQWLQVWTDSGHLHERGRLGHEYCMSRYGDAGSYELGNVFIQTNSQNISQAQRNRSRTPETCERIRQARLGKTSGMSGRSPWNKGVTGSTRNKNLVKDTI